jgi:hypothetical protein
MTGPEHYRAAEMLLAAADQIAEQGGDMGEMLAAAQVHATLALAAATAMGSAKDGMPRVDFVAWDKAAGVPLDGGADRG